MCDEKSTVSDYKSHVFAKIDNMFNLVNTKINKEQKNNIKLHFIISSHGNDASNENEEIFTIDGSKRIGTGMSTKIFYEKANNLFKNIFINQIVFLPMFCHNAFFRKFLIKNINNDKLVTNKQFSFYSLEPNIYLFRAMNNIRDYDFDFKNLNDLINNIKNEYKVNNDNNIDFKQYFIKQFNDKNILEKISLDQNENELINKFINNNLVLNEYLFELLPSQLISELTEASDLTLNIKLYAEYYYNYSLKIPNAKETAINTYIDNIINFWVIKFTKFYSGNLNEFFKSTLFKKYMKTKLPFIKQIKK